MQDAFAADDVQVVVATVAFGMGIDKSNVRFVVHYDLPKTVESYYQETGRSGRDGLPAEALLLFGLGDAAVVRSLIEGGGRSGNGDEEFERDPERVRIEIHKLNAMVGLADGLTCRREAMLGYFGEPYPAPCGNCDICLEPPETFDATEQAQMALSCVYRLRERDGFGYGVGYVIDVLRGTENEKVIARGHDRLSTFGIGAELSRDHWQSLIRQLIHRGYLAQDIARFSALRLTEAARPLLRGEETLVLAKPRTRVPSAKAAQGGRPARPRREPRRPRGGRGAVRAAARAAQAPRGRAARPGLRGVQRRHARRDGGAQARHGRRPAGRQRRRPDQARALRRGVPEGHRGGRVSLTRGAGTTWPGTARRPASGQPAEHRPDPAPAGRGRRATAGRGSS